jgi:hypothetical protein
MGIPPGLKNGLHVSSLPSGAVQVLAVIDGQPGEPLEIGPAATGHVVGQFLGAAKTAHDRTGKILDDYTDAGRVTVIQVTSIGLGPCAIPGHAGLMVRAGEAEIGFAIDKATMRALGEALIERSA